jgi:putative nucleotide binding protein
VFSILNRVQSPPRKYEEHAYVLDYNSRGKSSTVRGRDGIIITAIGEERLTLLEILGIPNSTFEVGEKIYIGKEGRTKVLSVLGKLDYDKISSSAQSELESTVENIVTNNESKFVEYLNNAQPLTPRIHALELIPGIGKTYMKSMLEERDRKKFESYQDLQERVGLKEPVKHIAQRIIDEVSGQSRMNLFVKR